MNTADGAGRGVGAQRWGRGRGRREGGRKTGERKRKTERRIDERRERHRQREREEEPPDKTHMIRYWFILPTRLDGVHELASTSRGGDGG